jgi:RNA polymerase sigma factor (sigma-70 family)
VLFRSIGKLRCAQAFSVWFYRIVVRQAVALEKRDARVEPQVLLGSGSDLDASLLRIDVAKALATLSAPQRIAIALHYYAEMNSREIAEVLAIPDSSVRFHIMRAKRALEQTLLPLQRSSGHEEEPYGAA